MKMKKLLYLLLGVVGGLFTSCSNQDWEFPDYEYSTVYFAYQSPVRTICLGEDASFDTSIDNMHQCQIMATMGGVYENNKNINISFRVDNSMCNGLMFEDSKKPLLPLPATHYTLSSNDNMTISKGKVIGGETVQLTDAFFADPLALENNYVIPVVLTNVQGADSILQGKPLVDNPRRGFKADWDVQPKDYIFYAVKYINKYDAAYLRRGVDTFSGNKTGVVTRRNKYVEKDEVVTDMKTTGLNQLTWDFPAKDASGSLVECKLILNFNENGECTITSATENVTASGSGKFVTLGEKNSWGQKDRDALYLDYQLNYSGIQCSTKDTLVVRDRQMKSEHFNIVEKE